MRNVRIAASRRSCCRNAQRAAESRPVALVQVSACARICGPSVAAAAKGVRRSIDDAMPLGHFPPAHCSASALGSTHLAANNFVEEAIVCTRGVQLRPFRWRQVQPQSGFASRAAIVSTEFGQSIAPHYQYDIIWRTSNHHFTSSPQQRMSRR